MTPSFQIVANNIRNARELRVVCGDGYPLELQGRFYYGWMSICFTASREDWR